jgi:hypothetical protein
MLVSKTFTKGALEKSSYYTTSPTTYITPPILYFFYSPILEYLKQPYIAQFRYLELLNLVLLILRLRLAIWLIILRISLPNSLLNLSFFPS